MSAPTKIVVAVASGYLLGRTKKLKLALTVGGLLAGRRIAADPQALLTQWSKLVEKNPELKKVQGQVTGTLVDAAKAAAVTTATQRIESLHRSLSESPVEDAEEAADEDEPADEPTEEPDEEPEETKPAPRKRTSAKKPAAKKSSGTRRSSASSRSSRSTSRK